MLSRFGNIVKLVMAPKSETGNQAPGPQTTDLEEQIGQLSAGLTAATTRKEELETAAQQMAQEKAALNERQNLLENEIKNLSEERDALILERNALGELRYRFEHERDVLQARVDRLESAAKDWENSSSPNRIASLTVTNEALTKQRNEYGELRYQLEHEKDLYRTECDRLKTEISNACNGREPALMPRTLIIFQHLAKTAGTTLADILTRNLPFDQQLRILPSSNPTAIGTWPHEVVAEAAREKTPAEWSKIRYLGGHLGFGVHRSLPGEAKYIAIFRDPVDRILSGFYYSIGQHTAATGERVSLEDYVFRKRHYDLGLNNYQTRVVSGLAELDPPGQVTTENARSITEADFQVAVENIHRHYLLTGITERFDEFLVLLARILGWSLADITYTRKNVTANRPGLPDTPSNIVSEIEKHNEFDRRLYEYANGLFEERIREYGIDFTNHLRLFQQFNSLGKLAQFDMVR